MRQIPRDTFPAALARKLNLQVQGNGPATLLMIHGYGCNQAMWRRMAPALSKRYRVVLLDLVGFGQSDFACWDAERYSGLEGHADDVAQVARCLGDQPLYAVGHSVGAMLAVIAELSDTSLFAAHVMVAPSPCFLNDGAYRGGFDRPALDDLLAMQTRDMRGWSNLVAGLVMRQPDMPDLTVELAESFCQAHPGAATALARATFLGDQRAALARLTKPTLILQSAEDDLAHVAVGQYMHEEMPASQLQVLVTSGHCPHLMAPDLCLRALEDFLGSLTAEADQARSRRNA